VVLFIFVGSLLNATGITHRLYEAAKLVVGRVKGGLAYVNVLANLVMAESPAQPSPISAPSATSRSRP